MTYKINELSGYVSQYQQLDPAAIRAQRLQELADIAEWRGRRLKAYQDWADPVKRAAIQSEVAQQLEKAKTIAKLPEKPQYFSETFAEHLKVTPVKKPKPKLKWWQRLLAWFKL